ncbi:uncharacterized protein [Diadema setosum]|uniref:uncharacterized protein n=1 Tax=Diadema setosum TaxID=31175 RepID=UPI003B3B304D
MGVHVNDGDGIVGDDSDGDDDDVNDVIGSDGGVMGVVLVMMLIVKVGLMMVMALLMLMIPSCDGSEDCNDGSGGVSYVNVSKDNNKVVVKTVIEMRHADDLEMKADDTVVVGSPAGIDQSLHSSGSNGGIGSDSVVALGIHLYSRNRMDLRWFACAVVCSLSVVQFSRASTTKDISDDCKVLIDMGFDVFHCTKSAYPDRDECVPRGRQADSRLRLRPGSFDPMSRVCDSRVDCTDGSDETLPECVSPHRAYCEDDLQKEIDGYYLDSFHCYGNKKNEIGSSMCVSECQMCDGHVDCPNGADELAENCSAMRQKPFGCEYF